MFKLCGFALSNYHNKVKLALMEKGVPFEEELVWADRSAALLDRSPLGKIPYCETEHGPLFESQVIMEYIEDAYPQNPLMPTDAYGRAKQRELVTFSSCTWNWWRASCTEKPFLAARCPTKPRSG